jgi:4-diphosphocytidyl-2-C-methyl-D-erythritol kinase
VKFLSPAKVNLFLNVLFKRKDGYHEIETLFERISLTDEITLLSARSGIKILSDSPAIPKGPKNLAYRAAKLLKERYKINQGVVITIRKKIPVAAGLGGGSSNAATTLIGLNKLWNLKLSKKNLMELGASLGSDVPIFILGSRFALGRGRGEILKEVRAPRVKIWHCLVKPLFGISTKKAYQSFNQSSLTPKKANVKMLLHSIQKGHSSGLAELLTNSLEHTLNKRVKEILEIKRELKRQGALGCLLSGSGPTVFGIYSSRKKALSAAFFLRKQKRWQVFVASTF